jgi:hypothetical protein
MLPKRKTTVFPDARACCGVVTRGLEMIIAGAVFLSAVVNMLTTCRLSVRPRSAVMNSMFCSEVIVRAYFERSATVCSSTGHLPVQPAGTSSPQ